MTERRFPVRISSHQLFTMGLVVFLIAFVIVATTFNYQARMMPLIIGVPVLLLAALQLVIEFRETAEKNKESQHLSSTRLGSAGEEQPIEAPAPPRRVRQVKAYAWTIAAFLAIYLVGFTLTTFFYPLLYIRFIGGRSWRLSGAISLGALAFLYIVMIYGLNVELYDGVIVLALRKAIMGY